MAPNPFEAARRRVREEKEKAVKAVEDRLKEIADKAKSSLSYV